MAVGIRGSCRPPQSCTWCFKTSAPVQSLMHVSKQREHRGLNRLGVETHGERRNTLKERSCDVYFSSVNKSPTVNVSPNKSCVCLTAWCLFFLGAIETIKTIKTISKPDTLLVWVCFGDLLIIRKACVYWCCVWWIGASMFLLRAVHHHMVSIRFAHTCPVYGCIKFMLHPNTQSYDTWHLYLTWKRLLSGACRQERLLQRLLHLHTLTETTRSVSTAAHWDMKTNSCGGLSRQSQRNISHRISHLKVELMNNVSIDCSPPCRKVKPMLKFLKTCILYNSQQGATPRVAKISVIV